MGNRNSSMQLGQLLSHTKRFTGESKRHYTKSERVEMQTSPAVQHLYNRTKGLQSSDKRNHPPDKPVEFESRSFALCIFRLLASVSYPATLCASECPAVFSSSRVYLLSISFQTPTITVECPVYSQASNRILRGRKRHQIPLVSPTSRRGRLEPMGLVLQATDV